MEVITRKEYLKASNFTFKYEEVDVIVPMKRVSAISAWAPAFLSQVMLWALGTKARGCPYLRLGQS